MIKRILKYFTPFEWALWLGGGIAVTVCFFCGSDKNLWSLFSSLFGITCIIFSAKGSVISQFVAIVFAALYAILSYTKAYYGEMLIYLFLMIPIHVSSIVSWMKNRNKGADKLEVKVNQLKPLEFILCGVGAIALAVGFYFLLQWLKTDNLIISTISLITSLGAAYLMLRRCEYFSLCFIANDVILIVLWGLKLDGSLAVLPSVISFVIFLANDTYCFINWKRIKHRQRKQQNDLQA